MKTTTALLLLLPALLAGCGPDQLISDLPSPGGTYHVEIRQCPERGSITWGQSLQVSVLEAGKSEKCNTFISALAQFGGQESADQLQLQWLSETELRAWLPSFNPEYGPPAWNHRQSPLKLVFRPEP